MSENIIDSTVVPNSEPISSLVSPVVPPPKKFPALTLILLILLLLTATLVIYLFLQVRQLTLEKLAPSPTPTSSPSADPTAAWQAYTNDLFSFNFKYPAGFSLTDNLQESLDPLAWTTKKTLTLTNPGNDCTILLMINPDGFGPWFPNKTITVGSNSLDGLSVIGENKNTENLAEKMYQIIVTGSISGRKVSGLWMSANCSDTPQDKDYLDATVNQILSSFKFTDYAASPSINSPKANAAIRSPLNITGSVPTGWMFEGQFPIEIRDSENRVVGSGIAHEVSPGSWSSGKSVDFSATVDFSPTAKSGFIFLLSDNPSGIPEKQLTFKLPVNF